MLDKNYDEKYRVVDLNKDLETNIINSFQEHKKPISLSEILDFLDKHYTIRPIDSKIRQAIWHLIVRGDIILRNDRQLEIRKDK